MMKDDRLSDAAVTDRRACTCTTVLRGDAQLRTSCWPQKGTKAAKTCGDSFLCSLRLFVAISSVVVAVLPRCVLLCSSVAAFCLASCSLALAAEQPGIVTPSPGVRNVFAEFVNVLETLEKQYIDPAQLASNRHSTVALREFVRSLDPEADLFTREEAAVANAPLPEGECDLGVSLTLSNDHPLVVSPRDGSAAQRAGLLAGDQISAIDGQPTARMRLFEVTNRLRGQRSSKVSLRVLDPGAADPRPLVIERTAPSTPRPALLKSLGNNIVYYRLSRFSVPEVEQLRAETMRAQARRAGGLILDLRNNAGGTFDATMGAARLFLRDKSTIVFLQYNLPELRTTFVSDAGEKITIPMVLLVNAGTAAEAEIFAAALRDNRRARLVGSQTFGRGWLYSQFALPDGSVLSIPNAQYVPLSRRPFQSVGLTPDIVVDVPRETERALSIAGYGTFDGVNDRAKVLKDDPVLARALELLSK
jgi:carboxyl-terminal processing protease